MKLIRMICFYAEYTMRILLCILWNYFNLKKLTQSVQITSGKMIKKKSRLIPATIIDFDNLVS